VEVIVRLRIVEVDFEPPSGGASSPTPGRKVRLDLKRPRTRSRLDQERSERRSCRPVALSFLYRLVRRVIEVLSVRRMDVVAKDVEILVLSALRSTFY
jgi:hypothetical protein